MINSLAKSLYIHIPYCKQICSYCDFCKKNYNFSECLLFILDLVKDLKKIKKKYKTIYIGGGTPTCIEPKLLELVLKCCKNLLEKEYEFTIESNPENLTTKMLQMLKKHGVNRLSVGIQTFDENIMKILHRDVSDVEKIIENAHKYIKNINIDIIYGMEFASFDILKNDLERAIKLPINHISIYSLIISPHTILFNKNVKEMNQDEVAKQYDFIKNFLNEHGFLQYEVSNFAKEGYHSRHNMTYWKNEAYDALGAGASGYDYKYRYKYTNNILDYIYNKTLVENDEVTQQDSFEYEILLGLRINQGINIEEINKKYNINFLEKYNKQIQNLISLDLIEISQNHLKCCSKGTFVQEEIFRKIIF